MKQVLFALLGALSISTVSAQNWSRALRINGSPATVCTIGHAWNNGVIAAGYTATDSLYCAVLDENGGTVQAWTMARMGLAAVSMDRNGGYYLLGKLEGDLVFTRFDTLGAVTWSKRIEVGEPDSVEWLPHCAIVQFDTIPPDSSSYDYVITFPAGEQNWKTLRMTKDGEQRWCDDHQGLQQFSPYAVPLALPNGNVLVGGRAAVPIVQCIDPNGQTLWMRRYPTNNYYNGRVTAMAYHSEDSVLVLIGNDTQTADWWAVLKLDLDGNAAWCVRLACSDMTLNHISEGPYDLSLLYGTRDYPSDFGARRRFPLLIELEESYDYVFTFHMISELMPYPGPPGTDDPDWGTDLVSRGGWHMFRAGNYRDEVEDTVYSTVSTAPYGGEYHCLVHEGGCVTNWLTINDEDHMFSGLASASLTPHSIQTWTAGPEAFDHCPVSGTSITEARMSDDQRIQPNPSTGTFNVRPPSDFTGRSDVHLMDLTGRVIPTEIDRSVDGTIEVRVQPGVNGMFLLQLQSAQRRWSGRVIVH